MSEELHKLLHRFDNILNKETKVEGMTYYCLGFLFDYKANKVGLINKIGGWQDGMVNGIGGKIEDGETPRRAMFREFEEETGARPNYWSSKAILVGKSWTVFVFSNPNGHLYDLRKTTVETPDWYDINKIVREMVVKDCPHVQMMIEICKRNVLSIIFDETSF